MSSANDSSDFAWSTNATRTRLATIDGFSWQSLSASNSVGNLQNVVKVLRHLEVTPIRSEALEEIEFSGQGGTFTVKKAIFENRPVAVKYVRTALDETEEEQKRFRRRLQCALREVIIMHHKSVVTNTNIPSLLGYGFRSTGNLFDPFIVVEFGEYGCLRDFLLSKGPGWPIKNKLLMIADICLALGTLHQAGIVHGDLKLDNIIGFVDNSRSAGIRAKIGDFDHSQLVWFGSKTLHYAGTGIYLAPEVRTQHLNPLQPNQLLQCDIWAFGLAVWEVLIAGKRYFKPQWRDSVSSAKTFRRTITREPETKRVNVVKTPLSDSDWVDCGSGSEWETIFGKFDLSNLQHLSKEAVIASCTPDSLEFDYLTTLLQRTLISNPLGRISNIADLSSMLYWLAEGPASK